MVRAVSLSLQYPLESPIGPLVLAYRTNASKWLCKGILQGIALTEAVLFVLSILQFSYSDTVKQEVGTSISAKVKNGESKWQMRTKAAADCVLHWHRPP